LPAAERFSSLTRDMATISVRPIILRLLLLLAALAAFGVLSWLVASSAIGDAVMRAVERTPNLPPENKLQWADLAVGLANRDPLSHLGRGGVYLSAATEEQNGQFLATALEELRKASNMNPEDYRTWLALGRALDRGGIQDQARQALESSVKLAPSHFEPRWALGNHLLRIGERDAAFAQFRQALAGRQSALPLVFDYAWDSFNGDGRAIGSALALSGEARSQMIALLVGRNRFNDAMSIWRETSNHSAAEAQQVSLALFHAGQMAAAYEVWNSVQMPDRPMPDAGSLLANGGFEKPLVIDSKMPFLTWRIVPMGGVKISLDRKAPQEGTQSLRIGFEIRENVPQTFFAQTVPVKPSTTYELSYAVKTEELNGWSMLTLEAIDAADAGRLRATNAPLPNKTTEWKEERVKFTTSAKTDAVTVRFQRQPCPDPPCLLTGRVLFDAFKLTEVAK